MLAKIQEEYDKSRLFFTVKMILTVVTIYFAIRVIWISVSGLIYSTPTPDNMNLLLFGMIFSLGLSNLTTVIQMSINKEKRHFILCLVTTIFVLAVSIYVLLLEFISM